MIGGHLSGSALDFPCRKIQISQASSFFHDTFCDASETCCDSIYRQLQQLFPGYIREILEYSGN